MWTVQKSSEWNSGEHKHENEAFYYRGVFLRQSKTENSIKNQCKKVTENSFLNVEEFNKKLKHKSKSCPTPDKINYQLL